MDENFKKIYEDINKSTRENYNKFYPERSESAFKEEMQERHEMAYFTENYTLNNFEYEDGTNWINAHKEKHLPSLSTVTSQFYITFTMSSIGDLIEIGCNMCKECKGITDLDKF